VIRALFNDDMLMKKRVYN